MKAIVGYQLLQVGDAWQIGDEYGLGFCFHIGNHFETGAAPGALVHQDHMCYRPRRPIWDERPFSVKELALRLMRTSRTVSPSVAAGSRIARLGYAPHGTPGFYLTEGWVNMGTGYAFQGSPPRTRLGCEWFILRRRLAIWLRKLAAWIDRL